MLSSDEVIKVLKDADLLKRVCVKSIRYNQHGYILIELSYSYYNKKSGQLVKEELRKHDIQFFVLNPEYTSPCCDERSYI